MRKRLRKSGRDDDAGGGLGLRAVVIMVAATGLEAVATRMRAGRIGGKLVVRCQQGHLFTTVWIPGASVKSLRLGWWRLQRCPVGKHWSIVTPVKESELTTDEQRLAHEHHDILIP
jgi:hypothetical protein